MNRNLLAIAVGTDGTLDVDKLLAYHRAHFGDARMDDGDDSDDETDGDDTDDEAADDGKGKDSKDSKDDKTGEDEKDDDAKLGAAGQKALDAIKAKEKAARARIRTLTAENAALKAGKSPDKKDEDKPDADQIREQARREADAEILNVRIMDKIEAKAGGRFELDPEDVAALVMRRNKVEDFLDADNKIDVEAISDALDELLRDRPSLASKDSKRFKGGADGGRRKDSRPKPKSLEEAITSKLSSKR